MVKSMTGFAARTGEGAGHAWAWEARSVNGKGLDLRLRLPEGIDGLEPAVRAEVAKRFARGNISLGLKLDHVAGMAGPGIDPAGLTRGLSNLALVEAEAARIGVVLRPSSAADILSLRGVTETTIADSRGADSGGEALKTALLADLEPLLEALAVMRAGEGQALKEILGAQVARIEVLTGEAGVAAEARAGVQAETFRAALARVMENADGADPARVAQEIALIAVKTDVTEELDRLRAHVAAARALLAETGPIGRRFDFLAQEFNREANTLGSKSNHAGLTKVALDLKATIDQMREQVQNVE
jgi:uncharacterized protein (TIGR00255 family)